MTSGCGHGLGPVSVGVVAWSLVGDMVAVSVQLLVRPVGRSHFVGC